MSEVDDLVAAINAAEADQAERYKQLYRALLGRRGFRMVKFGSRDEQWSNCWPSEPYAAQLTEARLLAELSRRITEIHPGDPP